MKKRALTVAVAATVASSAYAQMYVNPDKTGQYLIYPFYTADNGNQTLISVVNTTNQAKAVKVRILEAENSWEVRDFNLYLSPEDHFSFAITLDESGAARLDTADSSCTVPNQLGATGTVFTNDLFDAEENGTLERTINGHVEIIEMGQFGRWVDGAWTETEDADIPALWLHDEDGVPADCEAVEDLWTRGTGATASGDWYAEGPPDTGRNGWSGQGTVWRGGGLYGTAMVVNPDKGTAVGYDAIAVENFVVAGTAGNTAANLGGGAHLHYYPGDTDPGLASPATGISLTGQTYADVDGLGLGTFTYTTGAPALTMATLFQADAISNEYVLDSTLNGATDWIVTFPTKHFHVNVETDALVVDPFTHHWDGDESCDEYTIQTWDREEQTFIPQGEVRPPFSPFTAADPDDPVSICYETNVLTFATQAAGADWEGASAFYGTELSVSSDRIRTEIGTQYENGWAQLTWTDDEHEIEFDWDGTNGVNTVWLQGLPAVGFAAVQFENGTLSGGSVLANYQGAHEHKVHRAASTAQ